MPHYLQACLLHRQHHQVIMRLEKDRIELKVTPLQCLCQVSMLMIDRGNPLFAVKPITSNPKPTEIAKNTHKKEPQIDRSNPLCSEIPEWLQEFRENWLDDGVPERRVSHASSCHELSLEPTRSVDLGKHSVNTNFPKDRDCEICQRTKITRAPCRRRNGGAVPRAENLVI